MSYSMPERSLYTEEIRVIFRSFKRPFPELDVAIVDYGPYLALRIMRGHFESFPRDKKLIIMSYVEDVLQELSKHVPVYLEVL